MKAGIVLPLIYGAFYVTNIPHSAVRVEIL